MAVYQVGQSEYEVPDEVQGAQLQGVLEGLARQEVGNQEPQLPSSQFSAENLPEIGDSAELNELSKSGFLSSLSALSITDPKELGGALAKQVPGSFVSIDQGGNPLINFPSGTYAINKPGISGQDVAQFGFRAAAFTPAGRTSGALGQRVAQGASKSAATEAGLQAGEQALGGEFDTGEAVMAGVFGGAAEPVLAGLSGGAKALVGRLRKLKRGRQERAAGFEQGGAEESLRKADIAQEATRETGIGLSRAQQTTDPFLLEEQSYISTLPEGAKRGLAFITKQNEESGIAIENFLNTVAAPNSVVIGPKNLRTSAQKAIELRKLARKEKTSPLYETAFSSFRGSGQKVDTGALTEEITLRLSQYPDNHPASKVLKTFQKSIADNSGDLQKLHGVKEVIDLKIASLTPLSATKESRGAINKASREANEVQKSLVSAMEDVSTSYRTARESFIRESGPIDELRDSIVGVVADIKDTNLKSLSSKLLDPAQTNTEVVRQARRVIQNTEGGNDSWNQVVRSELERRLGSAKSELNSVISGDVAASQNVPAVMLTALGLNKSRSRKALMAALNPTQKRNLEFLETSLKRAAAGRPGGSQTEIRGEVRRRLDKGIVSAIRSFMKGPLSSVTEIGEEGARAARIRALSDSIFDDAWTPELAEIRLLRSSGRTKDVENKMLKLLQKVERSSISRGLIQAIRGDE